MADGSLLPFIAPSIHAPPEEIDVVYFAGVGGSSEAYKIALGHHPHVALNHKISAIGVHMANCPGTEHLIADVFDIDPRVVRPGVKWRSFWASPDCRHFSRAKGSAPVSPRVRGLAWIVVKVAKLLGPLAPDVIFVENVIEWLDWGPLLPPDAKGRQYPDPAHKGRTFRLWKRRMEQSGYIVEIKIDWVMGDYGAATTRKRLLVICRRDGQPIVWPAPTHAPRKMARSRGLLPREPAASAIDFSLPVPSIFLTQEECDARGIKAKRPLVEASLSRIAKGIFRYVYRDPFIVEVDGRDAAVSLARQFYDRDGSDLRDPVGDISASGNGRTQLVAAFLEQANTGMVGHDLREAMSTIVGTGTTQRLVTAHLDYAYGSNAAAGAGDLRDAIGAITAQGNHHYLVTQTLQQPFAAHGNELRAFLIKYYGTAEGASLKEPLHSITTLARFGLVFVRGQLMQITDIGMRMLTPRELATAQGFPRHYRTGFNAMTGKHLSKREEVAGIGNSVSPLGAAPFIAANVPVRPAVLCGVAA